METLLSNSARRLRLMALATLALLLSGCGFTPMHGTVGGSQAFSNVVIVMGEGEDENDREAGFLLRQHMTDRIGDPASALYTLEIDPRVRQVGLGLTGQDRATRFDSVLTARWTLRDAKTGDPVDRGQARGVATFSADRDPYRLFATNDAAVERVSRDVADTLLSDVALAIADYSAKAKAP